MQWRLHLGAHKTATTHLQLTLNIVRHQLKAKGTDYIPLGELRDATDPVLKQERYFRAMKFRRALRPLLNGSRSVILSEENFLGYPYQGCSFPPYQGAGERLDVIRKLGGDFVVFLSVRHPAQFAASIYAEAMRHDPNKVSLEGVRRDWLDGGSPWLALLETIAARFPDVRVWRYEDYREHRAAITEAVTGLQLALPPIGEPQLTKRLSQETITALEAIRAEGFPVPKAGILEEPGARFEMFSDEEQDILTTAYERDLERIEKRFPGALMRF